MTARFRVYRVLVAGASLAVHAAVTGSRVLVASVRGSGERDFRLDLEDRDSDDPREQRALSGWSDSQRHELYDAVMAAHELGVGAAA